MKTDLSTYDNSWYNPGSKFKGALWYLTNILFFRSPLIPFSFLKRNLLRAFGAKIGKGVVIKPRVNIKYPWFLTIDDYTWIGEEVWIDNLAKVTIGKNVCLSQGAMIICGSHNYNKSTFDLIIGPVTIEDGVWIGAQAIVPMNVVCKEHSILSLKSVATKTLEPYSIYQGNPAKLIKLRKIIE